MDDKKIETYTLEDHFNTLRLLHGENKSHEFATLFNYLVSTYGDEAFLFSFNELKKNISLYNLYEFSNFCYLTERFAIIVNLMEEFKQIIYGEVWFVQMWGRALQKLGFHELALPHFEKVISYDRDNRRAHLSLSDALFQAGRDEDAVRYFQDNLTRPLQDGDTEQSTLNAYDEEHAEFYNLATDNLNGTRLMNRFYLTSVPGRPCGEVLDLCCGTGHLALLLPDDTSVTGIDISGAFLKKAEDSGRYKALFCGDIVEVMNSMRNTFDTIFCDSALYHIFDLQPVFKAVFHRLNTGGMFVFSVDPVTDDVDIAVTSPGEFCHSRRYLRRIAEEENLQELAIRIDSSRVGVGFRCIFEKRSSS